MREPKHQPQAECKQGTEWTNEYGQTFPAMPLYRYTCKCGWEGAAWYVSVDRAFGHYRRHVEGATDDRGGTDNRVLARRA